MRVLTRLATVAVVSALFGGFSTKVDARICWAYSAFTAKNPQPWNTTNPSFACTSTELPNPGLGQNIGQEHRNWHCSNPIAATDAYGRAFLAFHRQFIVDFDSWRVDNGQDRLEIWDPAQNSIVPGNDETASTAFTNCSTPANVRPAGAVCAGCSDLPSTFIGSNLDSFSTLGEVGHNLEFNWHGSYHNGVRVLGCNDIGGFLYTSRDPAFWMAHKKLDEVATSWQSRQATDVVLVIDRSGSMDDNCSSSAPPAGESPCAINDAREAARTFANLVRDDRPGSTQEHRVGVVSFSTTAVSEVGLTLVEDIVTDNLVDDTPFEVGLSGISTGGGTSIAAGIREAVAMLSSVASPNSHQAILVLTDGKENTSPCLEGATAPCVSGDVLTSAEVGDVQIVAVGLGDGAEEGNLRDVAERSGGIFVAEADVDDSTSLQKFFVTAYGQIFDEAISLDPKATLGAGQVESQPFELPVCKSDDNLAVATGWEETEGRGDSGTCDLQLEVRSPSGELVTRGLDGVEMGAGIRHAFTRVELPLFGEHDGIWTGRLRRPNGEQCGRQEYFYTSLAKGVGKVEPFVSRPRVTPGRRIHAAFRLPESEGPVGGYESVEGTVTLTRPGGFESVFPLFDDASNGDKLAGNNIWSAELDTSVDEPGIYHLRGRFTLGVEGCKVVREAEYSLISEPTPEQCTMAYSGGGPLGNHMRRKLLPGEVFPIDRLACVVNRCASEQRYQVQIADSQRWLRTVDSDTGELRPLPESFTTGVVPGFETMCFGRERQDSVLGSIPIVALPPESATAGDVSEIDFKVSSTNANETVSVTARLEVADPPDCNGNERDDAIDLADGTSKDSDGNDVPDECEGLSFVSAGIDSDGDGIPDIGDNCIDVPNADQRDSDRDLFGNRCDADLNNDLVVNSTDLGLFRQRFLSSDPDADLDGSGRVNSVDLGLVKQLFLQRPGPSGPASANDR